MSKIPKIIHYCWFGKSPVPQDTQQYIDAWKKMCPDYKFMKWDEDNFDISKYKYTQQAYDNKKWAFVSDVCRLEKMYEYGGVYLDVKTEILKPLDDLLDHEMFVGFEQDNMIQMGVFGAKERHPIIKNILSKYYEKEHLLDEGGIVNIRTINDRAQEELLKLGMKAENSFQQLNGFTVYPKEYFCPRYWNSSRQDTITDNTYTIHYFGGSWHGEHDRKRLEVLRQEPLVSIIVPVYKVERYLRKCVESLIKQTYGNIEIILVDDKSPDKSGAICDLLAKKDKRITVIHKTKNEGLNMARKTGFETSHGQYITFLDSDDYFHEENIEKSLQVLCDNDAEVVIYGMQEFSNQDQKEDNNKQDLDNEIEVLASKERIKRYAFSGEGNLPSVQYMTVWGKLYIRSVIEGVDWKVANYRAYEDNFWTPQVLLKANKIVLTSNQLIFYRRNIAYGINGENLGNRLTGNSINGRPVGYMEFIERVRKFYSKLARENGFDSELDEVTNRKLLLTKSWRIDNLAAAGLMDSENNMEFISPFLREYIVAKNKHINNLDATIEYLTQSLAEANEKIAKLEDDNRRLNKKMIEFSGVKRSARLLVGNIKRKAKRLKN